MTVNDFPQVTIKTDSSTILQGYLWVLYVKKVISSASNNAVETKKPCISSALAALFGSYFTQ